MDKWEYKETERIEEREMNELGKDGWVLVFVIDAMGTTDKMYWKRLIK